MPIRWPFLSAVAVIAVVAFGAAACDNEDERPTAPELEDGVLQVGSDIA